MGLRVVAGSCRGRRLVSPSGDSTRPTADRVREAVFNSLGSMGAVADARVLDLFAGSGALGIEALSRGAVSCTFVDGDPGSIRAIGMNIDTCGMKSRSDIVQADAMSLLAGLRGGAGFHEDEDESVFDLAMIDPPYAFSEWPALLEHLQGVLADGAVVVVESDRGWAELFGGAAAGEVSPEAPPGYEVLRERRYGTTVVTIAVSVRGVTGDPRQEGRS